MNPEQLEKLTKILLSLKSKVKCSICLDHIENTVELECSHRFCNNCLAELRSQIIFKCPLCSQQIGRRTPMYKDQYADDLSKFTNLTCQLMKEKYVYEVDELYSKKIDLQKIIDTAPQEVHMFASNLKNLAVEVPEQTGNAFDRLKPNFVRTYSNKRKSDQLRKLKVLNFDCENNRRKIINWLSDNQNKLDALTQSPQFFCDEESDFQMPSISQVPPITAKQITRTRSQSLTAEDNLPEPLLKRYQSLTEGLNEIEDYDIEEIHSETLVKQVERKVLQDMLEDECLANLEHVAQLDQKKTKAIPSKKKAKSPAADAKNVSNVTGSSSGWDRIEDVKKSIERTSKKPRKLNIKLQGAKTNTRKPPKGNSNKTTPERKGGKRKNSAKRSKTVDEKEKGENAKEQCTTNEDLNGKTGQAFNLSLVENYFDKHMDNIKVSPDKNASSDIEIDIIDVTAKNTKEEGHSKINVDEQIFFLPTQVSSHCANQHNNICHISPIPKDFNDLGNIAIRLSDNLKSCLSSASHLHSDLGQQLIECFTNLLTYADQIEKLTLEKATVKIHNHQITNISRKSISTQTTHVKTNTVSTQSISSPIKTLLSKYIQTCQKFHNVEAQTDTPLTVEQGIQSIIGDSLKPSINSAKMSKTEKSSVQLNSNVSHNERKVGRIKGSYNCKSNKDLHTPVNNSKHIQSSKASDVATQDSMLMCSVDVSNKSEKKTNRKLTYEESQNRKFKRIRRPASDSQSDDDGNPSKRKFINDDLTIEFVDTQLAAKFGNKEQKDSASESEKMDYDKYLLEVMEKYDPSPPKEKKIPVAHITPKSKSSQLILDKKSNNQITDNKSRKDESQKIQKTVATRQPQRASQKDLDTGEDAFTANIALEENLSKFDQEILAFERGTTYNTEFDVVENTQQTIGPKPNKRLRLSCKTKESIKIITKGSTYKNNNANKSDILTEHHFNILVDSEPSTLNRNITNLPSQSPNYIDVADIVKNNEGILKSNRQSLDGQKRSNIFDQCRSRLVSKDVNMDGLSDNDKTNIRFSGEDEMILSHENIDKILENVNVFDDDDDDEIENELQKISFTAAQKENNKRNKINVLHDVKLRSPYKHDDKTELDDIIENSDASDEEIVETTPQKKHNSNDRSFLENFKEDFRNDDDVCLPPPPGFGDEDENNLGLGILRESPNSQKENYPSGLYKSSVTPDRLTDFIFTPDDKPLDTEKGESERSLSFKASVITPKRSAKEEINYPQMSQVIVGNSESVFSPIAKSSLKLTQIKYSPLVSTSKSTRKPNLMTSTPNQKSILNYVIPSQESPIRISQKMKPCIMWSRILNKDLNVFTQLECRKLLTTSRVFGPQVTHLIVLVDEKGQIVSHTAKILQAIAAGIWVVRYEWTQDCLKMNRIVPEEPYEALDTTGVPGPQIARLWRSTKPLFKGFKFYCAPPLKTVSKGDLESILQLSGGEIARDLGVMLENDGKIHIIVTESSATEETDQFDTWLEIYKAVTVDVEWLTSCIGQYKVVSFRPFLICSDESRIGNLRYPPTLMESVPFTLTEAS